MHQMTISLVWTLCSSDWHFKLIKLFISSISQSWWTRDHQGSCSTILQSELIRVVGLNSCLTDKMLKRSTLGGLSSHFLEAWTSRTKDRRDPVVIIGCPAVSGSVRGSKFPGIVSLIKDRNFIIWNYWLDPPDCPLATSHCPVLTNWIHSHRDSLCPKWWKISFYEFCFIMVGVEWTNIHIKAVVDG